MNNSKAHQKLVDDILFALGSQPHIRVWPRHVGLAVPFARLKKWLATRLGLMPRPIHYGIVGETDIQGIVSVERFIDGKKIGVMLAIEVKTGTGRLNTDQEKWKAMILKFGGIYVEARSVEDALTAVNNLSK